MHIGLIGGIGPATTFTYHRALVGAFAIAERRLDLTIAHADLAELTANLEAGAAQSQAEIFATHVERLRKAGCDVVAITSIGGHFCLPQLKELATLEVISALEALDRHFAIQGLGRIGVLGTRAVMDSGMYGLRSAEVVKAKRVIDANTDAAARV